MLRHRLRKHNLGSSTGWHSSGNPRRTKRIEHSDVLRKRRLSRPRRWGRGTASRRTCRRCAGAGPRGSRRRRWHRGSHTSAPAQPPRGRTGTRSFRTSHPPRGNPSRKSCICWRLAWCNPCQRPRTRTRIGTRWPCKSTSRDPRGSPRDNPHKSSPRACSKPVPLHQCHSRTCTRLARRPSEHHCPCGDRARKRSTLYSRARRTARPSPCSRSGMSIHLVRRSCWR
mmetsp:Transcript_82855/g.208721  ORF Transcript_82855/g.208721 Transcript_82855/m.208721 type:complete len:226 (+) Transcript_82855:1425-2102(+)